MEVKAVWTCTSCNLPVLSHRMNFDHLIFVLWVWANIPMNQSSKWDFSFLYLFLTISIIPLAIISVVDIETSRYQSLSTRSLSSTCFMTLCWLLRLISGQIRELWTGCHHCLNLRLYYISYCYVATIRSRRASVRVVYYLLTLHWEHLLVTEARLPLEICELHRLQVCRCRVNRHQRWSLLHSSWHCFNQHTISTYNLQIGYW